ncbi:MAG: hypothetical protein ILA34_01395 [Bacteroidaceae bacterium]|nr:hypothetical protein [Bacteroidaceae bacterium]
MHTTHQYNSSLARRMQPFIEKNDWQGLVQCLDRMTHSEFRTAGLMLSQNILPALDEERFWACFQVLYGTSPKAWLVTLLKSAVDMYADGRLQFGGAVFDGMCALIVDEERKIDEHKLLQMLLPVLKTPQEVVQLLAQLHLDDSQRAILYLLEQDTLPCSYVLFQQLRRLDHEPERLSLYCAKLLQKGSGRAFNLVSIVKNYFDLPQVRGTFSLKIPPYELSRLETSYDEFLRIMNRI